MWIIFIGKIMRKFFGMWNSFNYELKDKINIFIGRIELEEI